MTLLLLSYAHLLNTQLRIGTKMYAAKKHTGAMQGDIPYDKALPVLKQDLARLALMQDYAEDFKRLADDRNADIECLYTSFL
jgi:hypothetical protein